MGLRIDISKVVVGLAQAQQRTMFAMEKQGQAAAAKLEAKAKTGAPWTDRTGLARQTITGVCDWSGSSLLIGVAGNMDYSPYLELKNDNAYATLWPAINALQAEILQSMRGMI